MWTLVGDRWTLQRACTSSRIVDPLGFPASGLLMEVRYRDTFLPGLSWLVFIQYLTIIKVQDITSNGNRYLQKMNGHALTSWDEN